MQSLIFGLFGLLWVDFRKCAMLVCVGEREGGREGERERGREGGREL
jgi:hypothetical protein